MRRYYFYIFWIEIHILHQSAVRALKPCHGCSRFANFPEINYILPCYICRDKVWPNNVAMRYDERHLTMDPSLFPFFIRMSNWVGGEGEGGAIPSRLKFKALSSSMVKPFLVQEFESFVRERRSSYLWVTAYRPQAVAPRKELGLHETHDHISEPKIWMNYSCS